MLHPNMTDQVNTLTVSCMFLSHIVSKLPLYTRRAHACRLTKYIVTVGHGQPFDGSNGVANFGEKMAIFSAQQFDKLTFYFKQW